MKTLVTFGCSWVWGAGAGYKTGMPIDDYKKIAFDVANADALSFRTILANKFQYKNINMSIWRSSNKRQFRLARNFFSSPEFHSLRQNNREIVVLWGITSTGRNEWFSSDTMKYTNFLLSSGRPSPDVEKTMSEFMLRNVYDHDHEVFELAQEMSHWNSFFSAMGIRNYWFDSFNHHDYSKNSPGVTDAMESDYVNHTNITNFVIDHPTSRDLMSQLAISSGFNHVSEGYHTSEWANDTNRINHLVSKGLINPYSFHPTTLGHEQIASMFEPLFRQ